MAPTTSLHSFFRALTGHPCRTASHPDAVPEAGLNLPRRIDDPASAARVARDLLRSRREDVTLVLYMVVCGIVCKNSSEGERAMVLKS